MSYPASRHTRRVLELAASSGAGSGAEDDGPPDSIVVGQRDIGRIAEERAPAIVDDVPADPRAGVPEWARREGVVAMAGHPLLVDGELVGVVAAYFREPIGRATVEGLGAVADAIAIGVRRKLAERARAALEEQLSQIQKIEAVGRLAGGVAHDFNNVLTAILGYADLGLLHAREDPRVCGHLDGVRRAAERGSALTRQLLAFSRTRVLAPAVVDLNAVVRRLEDMLRRLIGEQVVLRAVLEPRLDAIRVDAGQLEQVILNLCINARDAMPAGGTLTLATRNLSLDAAQAAAMPGARAGQYVVLEVRDAGVGMGPEVRAHLFEPFFTTKEPGKGTGLGLSTAYGIVRQSEGHIAVESEVGRGTVVRVLLPRVGPAAAPEPPQAPAAAATPATPAEGGGERILLVEDEEMVRDLDRTVLERAGYTVVAAEDGVEALEIWERERGAFDLVLTDVVMPRMGGAELGTRLAAARPDVKILYVCGYTGGALAGVDVTGPRRGFLEKPFAMEALLAKVRELLDAPVKR